MTKYFHGDDVLAANLQGESVLLDMKSKDYFRLNETASFVWQCLGEGATRDELISQVVAAFEVDDVQAGTAIDALLAELLQRGLVRAD